jgi:hypothetical protein
MNEQRAFQYAVLRAVPRVDRGECVNVGVLLYCQDAGYLAVAVHLDEDRLHAIDPTVDLDAVHAALDGVRAVCAGAPPTSWPPRDRFGWLTAPRSTVVQAGPVHSGVTEDPDAQLQRLLTRLVLPNASA